MTDPTNPNLSAPSGPDLGERVREALEWFVAHRQDIQSDVSSAHSGRGNGASEWMREDDREFRADLRKAFDRAEAALSTPSPTLTPDADLFERLAQSKRFGTGLDLTAEDVERLFAAPAIRDQARLEHIARIATLDFIAGRDPGPAIRTLKGTPPSPIDADEVERENVLLRGKLAEAAAARDAAPSPDLLKELVEALREELRVMMLKQPNSGRRETYSDGFAQGLCHAITQIDATLLKLQQGGGQ